MDLFEEKVEMHGLAMIGGTESYFYRVTGNNLECKLIDKLEVLRNKKQKKGGQSAPRFQRQRLGQINDYIKQVCDKINHCYSNVYLKELSYQSIIIVGIGEIKDHVKENDLLCDDVKKKIKSNIAVSRLEIEVVMPLVIPYIQESQHSEELKIMEKFMSHVTTESKRDVYGFKEVIDKINENLLDTLIYDENMLTTEQIKQIETLEFKGNMYKLQHHHQILSNFGGIVGILYFGMDNTFDEDNSIEL